MSVIFDGTTPLGEAMAIVVRFVDDFLCDSTTYSSPAASEKYEIARELINSLSVQYSVRSDLVLAIMRDRASVNSVAVRNKVVEQMGSDAAADGAIWRCSTVLAVQRRSWPSHSHEATLCLQSPTTEGISPGSDC